LNDEYRSKVQVKLIAVFHSDGINEKKPPQQDLPACSGLSTETNGAGWAGGINILLFLFI
jgi:hypothetical protein